MSNKAVTSWLTAVNTSSNLQLLDHPGDRGETFAQDHRDLSSSPSRGASSLSECSNKHNSLFVGGKPVREHVFVVGPTG